MRETYLDSDFLISTAPATTYDTDLENFWTQSSKIKLKKKLIPSHILIERLVNE